ncbi:hypothetical protein BC829DRAFT_389010 [Chytridium lagenaria]|nr:hypothetical protein BC829DRAFT_389010 [Chytridium lagenaria]
MVWFLTHAQGQIRKKSYSVTPGTSRKSPIQTVDKPFSSSVDVSKDTALSISDLVRQARADDGFDDNIEDARCEAYFLSNGHCVYLSRSMTDWIGELPIHLKQAAPADSLDTKDFGGNIELLSEFKQKRREIRIAHTKYLAQHPELRQILADYLQLLLHRKPQNVFEFTSTWLRPKKSE